MTSCPLRTGKACWWAGSSCEEVGWSLLARYKGVQEWSQVNNQTSAYKPGEADRLLLGERGKAACLWIHVQQKPWLFPQRLVHFFQVSHKERERGMNHVKIMACRFRTQHIAGLGKEIRYNNGNCKGPPLSSSRFSTQRRPSGPQGCERAVGWADES